VIQFVKYRKTSSQISRFSDNNINRVNYWLQRGLNKLEVNLAGWCDVHQTQARRQEHSTHGVSEDSKPLQPQLNKASKHSHCNQLLSTLTIANKAALFIHHFTE